jgi:hypothetical protein
MSFQRLISFGSTVAVCCFLLGCGDGATHTPTELHDQKGEHLNYPAGGPNSPDYKKAAGKSATKAEPGDVDKKDEKPPEKKSG